MYNIIFYICNRMAGYAAIFSVRLRLLTRQSAYAYSLTELPPPTLFIHGPARFINSQLSFEENNYVQRGIIFQGG